jgi:hypothetical protein
VEREAARVNRVAEGLDRGRPQTVQLREIGLGNLSQLVQSRVAGG